MLYNQQSWQNWQSAWKQPEIGQLHKLLECATELSYQAAVRFDRKREHRVGLDPLTLWEKLAIDELIPADWVLSPARRFRSIQAPARRKLTPRRVWDVLLYASNVAITLQVEALAVELISRLKPWLPRNCSLQTNVSNTIAYWRVHEGSRLTSPFRGVYVTYDHSPLPSYEAPSLQTVEQCQAFVAVDTHKSMIERAFEVTANTLFLFWEKVTGAPWKNVYARRLSKQPRFRWPVMKERYFEAGRLFHIASERNLRLPTQHVAGFDCPDAWNRAYFRELQNPFDPLVTLGSLGYTLWSGHDDIEHSPVRLVTPMLSKELVSEVFPEARRWVKSWQRY